MAQNAADGGTRHCVLVQLPEPLDAKNKDQKVAADFCDEIGRPRSIAELTKERLRRAARQVRSGASDDGNRPRPATAPPIAAGGDLGFWVFKLDTSNIGAWDPNADDLEGSLLEHADYLTPGRMEQDVLYELLLKLGLDLCVPIETRTIASRTVHTVGAGALFVCLADGLDLDAVEILAAGIVAWREELGAAEDTWVVFKDCGFVDDVAKTNMAAILQQRGITDVRSL